MSRILQRLSSNDMDLIYKDLDGDWLERWAEEEDKEGV